MNLMRKCIAEFLGTYLLAPLSCGAAHSSILTGAESGLWQAVVWGLAIMLSIYGFLVRPALTASSADAHDTERQT
jgi:glycerol uptake facilitator protein